MRRRASVFDRILVANDGSEGAQRALSAAIGLAKKQDAELHMISVEELPRFPTSVDEVVEEQIDQGHRFETVIARAKAQAQAESIALRPHVLPGHAVPTICDFVQRERVDLLVVGYMGHSALYNRLIGSTTDRLVELAPCAVLVVK
jgi:nucleotide-binding universal stress UspA family protein